MLLRVFGHPSSAIGAKRDETRCRRAVTDGPGWIADKERTIMATCTENPHPNHTHKHGANCGHTGVRHEGHVDYLHDGHLHHMHEDHVDEHVIPVDATNPVQCTPQTRCTHQHGPACGHEAVPHGNHVDYLVNGRLHHPHGDHCDDHGPVELS